MTDRGYLVDRATQGWVRATGRRVALKDHPWLMGPVGDLRRIADAWLPGEVRRLGAEVREGGGLYPISAVWQATTLTGPPDASDRRLL